MSDNLLTMPSATDTVVERSGFFSRVWFRYVSRVTSVLTGREPLRLATYTVAQRPDPAAWPRCVIINSDTGELEISDGSSWVSVGP